MSDQNSSTGAGSGTGVTGNTPSATQTSAQRAASAARNSIKEAWRTKGGKNFIIGMTLALILVAMSVVYEWSFFWLLFAGIILFATAGWLNEIVAKSQYRDLLPWTLFLRLFGIVLIGNSILTSSFVTYIADKVNKMEQQVETKLTNGTPSAEPEAPVNTGRIWLPNKLGEKTLVVINQECRPVATPPGTSLMVDPVDAVVYERLNGPGYGCVRSKTGQEIMVHMYYEKIPY